MEHFKQNAHRMSFAQHPCEVSRGLVLHVTSEKLRLSNTERPGVFSASVASCGFQVINRGA